MPREHYLVTTLPDQFLQKLIRETKLPASELTKRLTIEFNYVNPQSGFFKFTLHSKREYVPTQLILRLWDVLRQHHHEKSAAIPIFISATWSEKEMVYLDPEEALRQAYTLRKGGGSSSTIVTSLPPPVIAREARRREITVDEFIKLYKIEFLYDGIEGGFFRFIRK